MKKITKTEEIYHGHSDKPIPLKDVTIKLEPDDIIRAGFDEGFYSDHESWDPYYFFIVLRDRLETDEEYEKRKKDNEVFEEQLKKRRYETYLKLKDEFEE